MADNDDGVAAKLTYFLIGAGVGAMVALLFAPKSGRELRSDIADATRRGVDYAGTGARAIGERASDIYDRGRERASQLVEAGRETVVRQRDQISAAIEAGKQAYQEEKRKSRAEAPDEG